MVAPRPNRMSSIPWLIGSLAVTGVFAAILLRSQDDDLPHASLVFTHAQGGEPEGQEESCPQGSCCDKEPCNTSFSAPRFTTTINRPSGPPTIKLQSPDPQGRMGEIACSTCHSVREANFANRTPADLDQFHQDMPMDHGSLTCYSCHNPEDADTLRLADSTVVSYPDVMTLCSQCHGIQARNYHHGAHGGMNGYWDLSRGPRTRNNCIDCHDPHKPEFPSMQPTFKPRDRFLSPPSEAHHE